MDAKFTTLGNQALQKRSEVYWWPRSDESLEEYVGVAPPQKTELELKEESASGGGGSMDNSPRIHAYGNIAKLSAETTNFSWNISRLASRRHERPI